MYIEDVKDALSLWVEDQTVYEEYYNNIIYIILIQYPHTTYYSNKVLDIDIKIQDMHIMY